MLVVRPPAILQVEDARPGSLNQLQDGSHHISGERAIALSIWVVHICMAVKLAVGTTARDVRLLVPIVISPFMRAGLAVPTV